MNSEILVVTTNSYKLREIGQILGKRVQGIGVRVIENGKTFEVNAIKKVKAITLKPNQIAIADDSGLMVDCLGGRPGVKSARFATPPTSKNLCQKLLKAMENDRNRRASFTCVIATKHPSGKIETVKGVCHGKIIAAMRGKHGFGYDPVFVPSGCKKTFAEMKPATKNRLSHRGRALQKLKVVISSCSAGERFEKLLALVRRLRQKCPWDREQTFESLKPHMIEEVHEAIEAIDHKDYPHLAEETGDMLLHIVMLAVFAEEAGVFNINDVIENISAKMVRRHPHVFGRGRAKTKEQVLKNWKKIKRAEAKNRKK